MPLIDFDFHKYLLSVCLNCPQSDKVDKWIETKGKYSKSEASYSSELTKGKT